MTPKQATANVLAFDNPDHRMHRCASAVHSAERGPQEMTTRSAQTRNGAEDDG